MAAPPAGVGDENKHTQPTPLSPSHSSRPLTAATGGTPPKKMGGPSADVATSPNLEHDDIDAMSIQDLLRCRGQYKAMVEKEEQLAAMVALMSQELDLAQLTPSQLRVLSSVPVELMTETVGCEEGVAITIIEAAQAHSDSRCATVHAEGWTSLLRRPQ